MNDRTRKMRTWTKHQSARYERSVDRRFSDYWAGLNGYGSLPVPGRLLAASKVRGHRG